MKASKHHTPAVLSDTGKDSLRTSHRNS